MIAGCSACYIYKGMTGYLSAIDITCHQHDCGIRETETRAMTMHDHELLMYDRGHSLHDLHPSFRD